MKSKADNPKTRDRQAGNRYFIDNAFLKTWGAKLGPHCIAVYNVLVMHANADSQTAFPSFQTIGDMTGMSRRQAVREIEKLKTNNIIRVEERTAIAPDTGKSYFLSNIFTLLHPDEWVKIDQSLHEPSDTQSLGVVSDSHQPSDTQSPPLVTGSHPNNTNLNNTTTKEGMNQIGDLCKEHFSDPAIEPYRTQLLETINRYSAVKVLWAIQTALSPDRQNGKAKSWGYVLGILEKDERRSSNQQALAARPRSKDKSPPISEAYRQLLEEDKTQVYNPLDRS